MLLPFIAQKISMSTWLLFRTRNIQLQFISLFTIEIKPNTNYPLERFYFVRKFIIYNTEIMMWNVLTIISIYMCDFVRIFFFLFHISLSLFLNFKITWVLLLFAKPRTKKKSTVFYIFFWKFTLKTKLVIERHIQCSCVEMWYLWS